MYLPFLSQYLILACLVLGINVIPAFMPPTVALLAYFYFKYDLNLIPVVIIGACMATFGRIILSYVSRNFFRNFLPQNSKSNMDYLGNYLEHRERITVPFVFFYAFLPIPSNQVFITAGLARLNIKLIAFSFFIGRLISYTLWIGIADRVSDSLENIFNPHYSKIISFAIELLIIYLVSKIDWKKHLARRVKRHEENTKLDILVKRKKS